MRKLLMPLLLTALMLPAARAAVIFTPHIAEYAKVARGEYIDTTFLYSSIDKIWDADGHKVALGNTAIPPGQTIDTSLLLARYLWVGNLFEDTRLPFLPKHDQFLRVIGSAGRQQGSGAINDLSRQFGQTSSATGLGDLFLLAGVYGSEYHLGPLHGNELYSVTVKAPIGQYDQHSLLNNGTHYWSTIPQIGHHEEWFGKLFLEATAAYQFNGSNGSPAYGGLTPTRPADSWNLEANLAWKFNEHWYAEAGFTHVHSVGANRFDKVTLNLRDQPVPPTTACNTLLVPASQCSLLRAFYLAPVPGDYRDSGVFNSIATAGLSYIYRSSSVISLRAALPLAGRGSQITVPYYTCVSQPCTASRQVPGTGQIARLTGVQESSAIPASPYFELRFVFLLFAP